MDDARRVVLLRKQIEEANRGQPADFKAWKQRTHATMRATMGAGHPLVNELDEVRYGLMMASSSTPQSAWDAARANGVRSAIAVLEGAIHEIEIGALAPAEVEVADIDTGASLHPWVADAASGLWNSGHHRQAVEEATRAIGRHLREKLDTHQTGAALLTEAFSPKPPTATQKRLRFVRFTEGTRSWTSAHEGAMYFGRGCMLRIRNLVEHEDDAVAEQVAAECLAALSLLARWIEEAVVVTEHDW